jgi:hypothetical protein
MCAPEHDPDYGKDQDWEDHKDYHLLEVDTDKVGILVLRSCIFVLECVYTYFFCRGSNRRRLALTDSPT